MLALLISAVLAAPVEASPLQEGAQLTFKGAIAQVADDGEPGEPKKVFELSLFVAEATADGARLIWQVQENGRGRWAWPERFGELRLDAKLQATGTGPSLLYDRGDGLSVIPITLPLLAATEEGALKEGLAWTAGDFRHLVARAAEHNGRETWRVDVSNNYGPQRVLWAAKEGPLVLGLKQKVFMGMGQEFALTMDLAEAKLLEGEELSSALTAYPALLALRGKMQREPRSEEPELSAEDLAAVQQALPEIQKSATAGIVVDVVKAARRDLAVQSERAGAIDRLAEQHVGKQAPNFDLEGLDKARLTDEDLKGRVTVLHFWEYRDSPLDQPYGQIGYLDFMFRKGKEDGPRIVGVASDARLREAATVEEAVRSAKKLQKFMNLSYPILLDDGRLLKDFGDPRLLGAELPLFVVIGPDGKIAHYHVGHYEVDQAQGLQELNAVVAELLAK